MSMNFPTGTLRLSVAVAYDENDTPKDLLAFWRGTSQLVEESKYGAIFKCKGFYSEKKGLEGSLDTSTPIEYYLDVSYVEMEQFTSGNIKCCGSQWAQVHYMSGLWDYKWIRYLSSRVRNGLTIKTEKSCFWESVNKENYYLD